MEVLSRSVKLRLSCFQENLAKDLSIVSRRVYRQTMPEDASVHSNKRQHHAHSRRVRTTSQTVQSSNDSVSEESSGGGGSGDDDDGGDDDGDPDGYCSSIVFYGPVTIINGPVTINYCLQEQSGGESSKLLSWLSDLPWDLFVNILANLTAGYLTYLILMLWTNT